MLSEWYTDPIEEDIDIIPADAPADSLYTPRNSKKQKNQKNQVETFRIMEGQAMGKKKRYHRDRAVAYAQKYAGAAWGAGNNNRYNKSYRDYTYLGGDCTNFASQVIGDPKEGGGLPMTMGWRYWYNSGGTRSWVQTDAFKNFLLNRGYGRLIARGYFADVVKPTDRYPKGAISVLQPGDLIAYEFNGDVDHFSVVVGYDRYGYPLVNSHTGDRNLVPWDLGWGMSTKFLLIHIND
ncbi:amidase domain-containing protein [Brevibacillus massiliensis]|uniref:amidase domain-containing protein n=1 Tax=Brevibacillus massiliensis TaxID=1118054 RepID=UPI00031D523A|nr:amidase domain-containing protein [Brevibacillus massiliensis]